MSIFNPMLSDLSRVGPSREKIPTPITQANRQLADGPAQQAAYQQQQPPMQPPGQGMQGYQSPIQSLFQQYMQNIFKQKYAPQMTPGSPLQNYGGFMGFASPNMPMMRPQSQYQPSPQVIGYDPNRNSDSGI